MKTWLRVILAMAFFAVSLYAFHLSIGAWEMLIVGGAFLFATTALLLDKPRDPNKRPGPFHEGDGSLSMRRIAASFLFVSSVGLFVVGAINDHQYAFLGGLACLVGGILLLFFTTWADITALVSAIPSGSRYQQGGGYGSYGGYSPPKPPISVVQKADISAEPPKDPSLGG